MSEARADEPDPSVLERLRAETRTEHDAIEGSPLLQELFSGRPGREAYRVLLERKYGFHRPVERILRRSAPGLLADRARSNLLACDLNALGLSLGDLAALPEARRLPPLDSHAARLGVLYVLEGATLGGQVILNRLSTAPDPVIRTATRFFRGHGPATGRRWQAFRRQLLSEMPDDPRAHDTAVAAAADTFDCLRRWIEGAAFTDPRETRRCPA